MLSINNTIRSTAQSHTVQITHAQGELLDSYSDDPSILANFTAAQFARLSDAQRIALENESIRALIPTIFSVEQCLRLNDDQCDVLENDPVLALISGQPPVLTAEQFLALSGIHCYVLTGCEKLRALMPETITVEQFSGMRDDQCYALTDRYILGCIRRHTISVEQFQALSVNQCNALCDQHVQALIAQQILRINLLLIMRPHHCRALQHKEIRALIVNDTYSVFELGLSSQYHCEALENSAIRTLIPQIKVHNFIILSKVQCDLLANQLVRALVPYPVNIERFTKLNSEECMKLQNPHMCRLIAAGAMDFEDVFKLSPKQYEELNNADAVKELIDCSRTPTDEELGLPTSTISGSSSSSSSPLMPIKSSGFFSGLFKTKPDHKSGSIN